MTTPQPRQPKGSPAGGEFAETSRAEAATTLVAPQPVRAVVGTMVHSTDKLNQLPLLTIVRDADNIKYLVTRGETRFGVDLCPLHDGGTPTGKKFAAKFAEPVLPLTIVGTDQSADLEYAAARALPRATCMVEDYAAQFTGGETDTAVKDILTDLHQWAHANEVSLVDVFMAADRAAFSEREEDGL